MKKKNIFGYPLPAGTKIAKILPMVQATYTASCTMMVRGVEMACPLCGTLVQSGERHSCKVTRRNGEKLTAGRGADGNG